MSRNTFNVCLDFLSLLVMLGLATTGGIIHFVLPAGTGQSHVLFGLGRHDYGQIHFYLAATALPLLALHVALHWSWVCSVAARVLGKRQPSLRSQTRAGLAVLLGCSLLLGLGLWWASARVKQRPGILPLRDNPGARSGATEDTASPPDDVLPTVIPGSNPTTDTPKQMGKGTFAKIEEGCHWARPSTGEPPSRRLPRQPA